MSPPAVEIRSTGKFSAFFPESNHSHDQRNMDPSSFPTASGIGNGIRFGFEAGLGRNTKSRPKPRLVKLRKNDRKVKGNSSDEILSGFNPFAPPSKGNLHKNSMNDTNDGESPGNRCFIFGACKNSSEAKAPSSDEEEFSTPIGESDTDFTKQHSNGFVRKIDKENQEHIKPSCENTSCDGEKGLRFDSDENGSWKSVKNPYDSEGFRRKNDRDKNTSDTCREPNSVKNGGGDTINGAEFNMKKLNISDTGFNSGNSYEDARKSNNKPAFIFGSTGKVDVECKGVGTSRPCSFSSNGFHQSDNSADKRLAFQPETTNINNLTSTTFGIRIPFDDFKLPQLDPSLLKNSLFPEVSRNPVHVRRTRSSKDNRSKKIKEKMKQCVPNRCNNHASKGIESQENLSSPGYCSPMDFSPYEGEKASNQLPTEIPPTSIDPSHSRDHVNSCSGNEFKVSSASVFKAEDHGSNCMPTFSFSASISQGKIPNKKLQATKKYRRKVSNISLKNNLNATTRNNQENQPVNTGQAKQESGSTSVIPDVCEVWRLRGNQAYRNGDICKAEEYYSHGIKSSRSRDNSEYSAKPLALCYGNRAAARISLGKLREAISDCEMAASLDPSYVKAYMRAANCHLVLGELETAVQYFNKCMESVSSVCLDRRITIESAEGLQQAQRVAEYSNSASIFMEKRTPEGASDALVLIANALSISSCSDKLLQMKAEALFMIRHYKEVIELCENTLQTAEKNSVSSRLVDGLGSKHHSVIVWRWNMISKSHFYLGNLEMALDILEKLQQVGSSQNENQEECHDSPASLVATISELLRYKNAGNEAVRAGKYMEAVEQYTAALSRNVDSRPFAAICFCNRAAANQALVQITDAIADCSLAMALDENYTKAVSRRATLHEMIRDYDQAATDLQRLIGILVKQDDEKKKPSESSADRPSSRKELRQARQRLSVMENKSKEGIPLDFFLIMGVKKSDTAADIKKAYRKAALRHHPDKAAQILVRSEREGPWLKEILEEVHKGADRLFKMIGEAYSVLSDPTKRSDYELEEEIRKAKASRESYRSRKAAETSSPPSWRYSKTYRNTPSWW